jgi:DNA polymerase-3 subunit alpha
MYTPLGIKTDYSILSSLIKIKDLMKFAVDNHFDSLGILDDNLNSSHVFLNECKKNNIKGIVGLDFLVEDKHIYLYPINNEGLKVLFNLLHDSIDNIIKVNDLKKYNEKIIAVVPYESREIYNDTTSIYDEVYMSYKNEMEEHLVNNITKKNIFINPILALSKESSKYINYLTLIKDNKKLGEIEFVNYESNVLTKETYDTSFLVDKINISFDTSKRYIPVYKEDSKEFLYDLASKGLNKRLNGKVTKDYSDRLNYELDIISKMGFVDYFLIVYDYVKYAYQNKIYVGVGRGSAVGSLVAYSLGITSIDPLKYNLLFERFLNPERVSMPDIDIDFEDERREEVVQYIKDKYGKDYVANIIAYGTMTAKEVLRTVAKINNLDDNLITVLLRNVDSKLSLRDNLDKDNVKDMLKHNYKLKKVYDEAYYLEGIKHHLTVHAAGVVISSEKLSNLVPIVSNGSELLVGFDKDEIEELGLLKMDILSLKNLSLLKDIKASDESIDINKINLEDKEVYKLFSSGDTSGIFQFESSGMKNFLRNSKPSSFNDLIISIAMFRPGPAQMIDTYIDRKNNGASITYLHDDLKPILQETYGILVYQEQVIEILKKMGGYTLGEADVVRKAISKKKTDVIEKERMRFKTNALKNGYDEKTIDKVFELIIPFSGYGFNKSHAVAYALFAYQMAYLKVHYKEHFYINLLNNNIGADIKNKEYLNEAKRNGIKVLKPDINKSYDIYKFEDGAIRLPFTCIKGIGMVVAQDIVNIRDNKEFKDYYDFIKRITNKSINRRLLETLIMAGVFDSLGLTRKTLINNLDATMKYAELIRGLDDSLVSTPEVNNLEEFSDIELMNAEKELYGYFVSAHPSNKYDCMKLIDVKNYFNKTVKPVVIIDRINKIKTKNDKDMAFITASDETSELDFVIWDDKIKLLDNIEVSNLVEITGIVERRYDKYQINVKDIKIK